MSDSTVTLSAEQSGPRKGELPHLFLVLQSDRLDGPSIACALDGVDEVRIGRGAETGASLAGRILDVRIADARTSSAHARLVRVLHSWLAADLGSKNGTFVNGEKIREQPLEDGDLLEVGRSFLLFRAGLATPPGLPAVRAVESAPVRGLATLRPDLEAELAKLRAVAKTGTPVIIGGESGTGKELAARAVHEISGRRGPLVAVNCAALPPAIAASELFGHRKGAFTGADEDRPGLVRASDGGTLFLDEVGDLGPDAQAMLLRVLQEQEVLAVGASRPVKVDLRVVAATHRDLRKMASRGAFRADLLARLAGYSFCLPPLRERTEDVGLLLGSLARRHFPQTIPQLTNAAARAVLQGAWPLNIRELERALISAAALAGGGAIDVAHLPPPLEPGAGAPSTPPAGLRGGPDALRERLVSLLEKHRGNVSAVAAELGKARTQVHRWLNHLGLDAGAYRG